MKMPHRWQLDETVFNVLLISLWSRNLQISMVSHFDLGRRHFICWKRCWCPVFYGYLSRIYQTWNWKDFYWSCENVVYFCFSETVFWMTSVLLITNFANFCSEMQLQFNICWLCAAWPCDAIDYVDPRRFRREDGEGCEKLTENQLQSDYDTNESRNVQQSVSKPQLLLIFIYRYGAVCSAVHISVNIV